MSSYVTRPLCPLVSDAARPSPKSDVENTSSLSVVLAEEELTRTHLRVARTYRQQCVNVYYMHAMD